MDGDLPAPESPLGTDEGHTARAASEQGEGTYRATANSQATSSSVGRTSTALSWGHHPSSERRPDSAENEIDRLQRNHAVKLGRLQDEIEELRNNNKSLSKRLQTASARSKVIVRRKDATIRELKSELQDSEQRSAAYEERLREKSLELDASKSREWDLDRHNRSLFRQNTEFSRRSRQYEETVQGSAYPQNRPPTPWSDGH